MSDPKRYTPCNHRSSDDGMAEQYNGKWVKYDDYAALKAEVERLRKAGDAMYFYITDVIVENRISSPYLNKLQDGWDNAAKEGRDAK